MKVVSMRDATRVPATGDLFIGPVDRQAFVGEGDSELLRVNVVTFKQGAVNKYHSHSFDQVLVVTEGDGIVQVEGQPERPVTVGDIIFVPSGERHWHGAAPGKTMAHLTIATPGTTEM